MTRVTTEVSTDLDGHITHRQSPTRPNDGGAVGAGDQINPASKGDGSEPISGEPWPGLVQRRSRPVPTARAQASWRD